MVDCELCERSFDSFLSHSTHLRHVHDEYDAESYHKEVCSNDRCEHDVCVKQRKIEDSDIVCEVCGDEKFETNRGLGNHIRHSHDFGTEYYHKNICTRQSCDQMYCERQDDLEDHENTVKCKECGRKFKKSQGLSTHIGYKHGLNKREYYSI